MLHLFGLISGDGLIFAIFVLGILAFPYSPEIQRLLRRVPFFRALMKDSDAARFVVLRRVHNSSYQLIVLILGHSIKLLIRWVAMGVGVLLIYDAISQFSLDFASNTKIMLLTVAIVLVCPILGIIQWVFWTRKLLFDLREYHEAAKQVARETRSKSTTERDVTVLPRSER
jgi:hypothetical protein